MAYLVTVAVLATLVGIALGVCLALAYWPSSAARNAHAARKAWQAYQAGPVPHLAPTMRTGQWLRVAPGVTLGAVGTARTVPGKRLARG